jgi:pimeloyl-ACP methyl ester carboxylesterase
MYESYVRRLGAEFTAFAIDTPGYGNSEPLPIEAPTITDYADALGRTLDALGITRCALYGAHTGACIALELAAREQHHRVVGLVLDGLPLLTDEERRDLLEHYCPVFEPDIGGAHLIRAWTMRRDMHLFFPWYRRSTEASVRRALPDAETLHRGMMEYLRAGRGYHRGYDAAFRYEPLERLRTLTIPTAIIAAETDGISEHLARLPDDLPPAVTACLRPADPDAAAESLTTWLRPPVLGEPAAPRAPRPLPRHDRLIRGYASTRQGQLHLRFKTGGPGRPLLLIHGSPTSARTLEPLMVRLAQSRPVYAFDTLGNGDSAKPDPSRDPRFRSPAIADFAEILVEAVTEAGIGDFDIYGTHTGAAIGIETALLEPTRVGRLILDGVAMFDATTVAEFLEHYFVDLSPRTDGSHLLVVWACARDSTIWFPWYRRDPDHRYRQNILDADALDRYAVEFLKSGSSYALPYRAAFTYRAERRLPLLTLPTLVASRPDDPLVGFLDAAVQACPGAEGVLLPDDGESTATLLERFLDARPPRGARGGSR